MTTFRDWKWGLVAVVSLTATSITGQIATFPNLAPWYASLQKPDFNPPNWIFGPVWTSLYVLMAFALWKVLRRGGSQDRRIALVLFYAMLVLNAAWSWMFFAANSPLLGLINIVPQLALIIATIVMFWRVDRIAAWCLVPLAAWVAFATLLNFSIWQLNA